VRRSIGSMAPGPLLLVLLSALLHALWNAILKKQSRPDHAAVPVAALAALVAALAVPFGTSPAFPHTSSLLWGIGAGVCEGAYFTTLGTAFRRAPLGSAYAVSRGGAIALVWPASVLLLDEPLTAVAVLGTGLVIAGLVVFGFAGAGERKLSGFGWSLACAVCIATYHLCYKQALAAGAQPAALSAVSLAVALPLNLVFLGRGSLAGALAAFRGRPESLIVGGVVCAASFLVFLSALGASGAGAVLTVRNVSVLFALGMSRLIGERPGRPQVVGALLVTVGAILVGWPAR